MSKAPDLENLAKTYLDLWQDQFASMAADPATADAMARLFGTMAAGWVSSSSEMGGTDERGSPSDEHASAAPDRTAAAATPLRNRSDGVPELLGRIAELERRIDALERGSHPTGGSPKSGTRKRRS